MHLPHDADETRSVPNMYLERLRQRAARVDHPADLQLGEIVHGEPHRRKADDDRHSCAPKRSLHSGTICSEVDCLLGEANGSRSLGLEKASEGVNGNAH